MAPLFCFVRDHIPVTVFQMKRPTVRPLLLCLPQLLVYLCQPLVLTVGQTLLVFSYLFLVNWSSHLNRAFFYARMATSL